MWLLLSVVGCADPPQQPQAWLAPGAPSPLRRLSPDQHHNAITDLFPGVQLPPFRLPADPRIGAFDHMAAAQSPSPLWIEAVQTTAVQITAAAMDQPGGWLPCPADGGPDPASCGRGILRELGRRAFRRPLTEPESALYLGFFEDQLAQTGSFRIALQLTLQAILSAPEFLYLLELQPDPGSGPRIPLSGHEVAARLSFTLWNTLPDERLHAAALSGALDTADGVEAEAWRMLEDPRSAQGVLQFHHLWLDLSDLDEPFARNPTRYPSWDPAWVPSLQAETRALVWGIFSGPEPTLSELLLNPQTDADPVLSEIYGIPPGPGRVPEGRAGVLTRPAWLTVKGNLINPSPVQRGVWVLDRLLCTPPAPPPDSADLDLSVLQTDTTGTNRDRYHQHTADPACAGCHEAIDGLGFGFEHFDSIGIWQDLDGGLPVDATGVVMRGDLAGTSFDGAAQLSWLLARSETAHRCFARQWFRYAHGRTETHDDAVILELLEERFLATGGDLRSLLIEIVRSETFRTRRRAP